MRKAGAYPSGAPFTYSLAGWFVASPANIGQGWKGLPRSRNYSLYVNHGRKSFKT